MAAAAPPHYFIRLQLNSRRYTQQHASMPDHLTTLRSMIDRALAHELTVSQFERDYALYWYERVPVDLMRSSAASIYSGIVEKLEFVKDQPTESERQDDWIDPGQFLEWLASERRRLAQTS